MAFCKAQELILQANYCYKANYPVNPVNEHRYDVIITARSAPIFPRMDDTSV